jgi:hypothetical protein
MALAKPVSGRERRSIFNLLADRHSPDDHWGDWRMSCLVRTHTTYASAFFAEAGPEAQAPFANRHRILVQRIESNA